MTLRGATAMHLYGSCGSRRTNPANIYTKVHAAVGVEQSAVSGSAPNSTKAQELFEAALVVRAREMGRTPFDSNLVNSTPGRDHKKYGLSVWMARGRIRTGTTFGETDDSSGGAARDSIPHRDVHAPSLRLLPKDQFRLPVLHPAASSALPTLELG